MRLWQLQQWSGLAAAVRMSASRSDTPIPQYPSVAVLLGYTPDAGFTLEGSLPSDHVDLSSDQWFSSEDEITTGVAQRFRWDWDFPFCLLTTTTSTERLFKGLHSNPPLTLAERVAELVRLIETGFISAEYLRKRFRNSDSDKLLVHALDTLQHSPWFAAVYRLWTEAEPRSWLSGCQSDPGLEKTVVDIVTGVARIRQVRILQSSVQLAGTLTTVPPRSTAEAVEAVLSELERTVRLVELQSRKEKLVEVLKASAVAVAKAAAEDASALRELWLQEPAEYEDLWSKVWDFVPSRPIRDALVSREWRDRTPLKLNTQMSNNLVLDNDFRDCVLRNRRDRHIQLMLSGKAADAYLGCVPDFSLDALLVDMNETVKVETLTVDLFFTEDVSISELCVVNQFQGKISPEKIRFHTNLDSMEDNDIRTLLMIPELGSSAHELTPSLRVEWGFPDRTNYHNYPQVDIQLGVTDLSDLQGEVVKSILPQVVSLDVGAVKVETVETVETLVEALKNMTKLKSLNIEVIQKTEKLDLTYIGDIGTLETLVISSICSSDSAFSVEWLRNLKHLKSLILYGCFASLEPLANLNSLENLTLKSSRRLIDKIFDINPVGSLIQLKRLSIKAPRLCDFVALAHLKNLGYLDVAKTQFSNMLLLLPARNSLIKLEASKTTNWSEEIRKKFPYLGELPGVTQPFEPETLKSKAAAAIARLREFGRLAYKTASKMAGGAVAWVKDNVHKIARQLTPSWLQNFKFPFRS